MGEFENAVTLGNANYGSKTITVDEFETASALPDAVSPAPKEKFEIGVTPRAVTVLLLLAAWSGFLVPVIDLQLRNTKLGAGHLPIGAVLLFLLLVVNPLIELALARLGLDPPDSTTIQVADLEVGGAGEAQLAGSG